MVNCDALLALSPADKLSMLRRLDPYRAWNSLGDKRRCLQCRRVLTGHDIEVAGGTRGRSELRLCCPTPECRAVAIDFALVDGDAAPLFGNGTFSA